MDHIQHLPAEPQQGDMGKLVHQIMGGMPPIWWQNSRHSNIGLSLTWPQTCPGRRDNLIGRPLAVMESKAYTKVPLIFS